jgi:cytochrome c556
MILRNRLVGVSVGLAALGSACAAYAASPAIIAAINARKSNYKEIGGAFKTINDEIKTGSPDLATVRPLARDLVARASGQLKYFPKGSGPGSGEKTRAKAAIWTDQATFVKLHNNMLGSARALQAATDKGDVAAMASARTALGGACKACHDKFRESD